MTPPRPAVVVIALSALAVGGLGVAALVARGGTPVAERTPGSGAAEAPTDAATEEVSAETLDEQLSRVAELVAQVRGFPFTGPPDVRYVDAEELAANVREELAEYTTEAAELDGRILTALGVLTPGTDLRELVLTAYGEQVAGYYDPEIAQIVVPSDKEEARLGRIDELTLAHEIGHALVDSNIGLVSDDTGDQDAIDEDAALALTALQEGDAELVMLQYVEVGFSLVDQFALATEAVGLAEQLGALTQLPPYLQGSLEFPYLEGLGFVTELFDLGGWDAVNAAYVDPPTTTYEILFPQAYLDGFEEVAPAPFTAPGGDWVEAHTVAMGAADVLLLFEDAQAAPTRAAQAWRGGELRLWTRGDESTVAWNLAHAGGDFFCAQFRLFYDGAIDGDTVVADEEGRTTWEGPRQAAVLDCDATTARLGIAPDAATAAAVTTR